MKERENEIRDDLALHNQNPKPLKWTASAEAIIEKSQDAGRFARHYTSGLRI